MKRALFVLVIVALAACNSDQIGGPAAGAGRIAYVTDGRIGIPQWDIYLMNPNGSQRVLLEPSFADDTWPNWTADGQKIAFQSNRIVTSGDTIADNNIFVINADGTGLIQLTTDTTEEIQPVWSLDGTKIAFATNRDSGDYEIYVMIANGANQARLTRSAGVDWMPAWSPDGTKIAFASNRDSNLEIYVMNAADGSGLVNLTKNAADDYEPAWSPDGQKIAFARDPGGSAQQQIWVMGADGTGAVQLTHYTEFSAELPSWSPDDKRIAYDAASDIWIMFADGTQQTRVTRGLQDDVMPRWRP